MSDTLEKPAGRTARLNLLVTEAEKAEIERRAAETGLTVSEFIRRAADGYDPSLDRDVLAALVSEVGAMAGRVLPKLDEALLAARTQRVTADDRARWRQEALAEAGRTGARA